MEEVQSYSVLVFLSVAPCLMLRHCKFFYVFKRPSLGDLYLFLKGGSCCYLKYLKLWKIYFQLVDYTNSVMQCISIN